MNDYGEMFYGTLPQDTQDFRGVLAGIARTIRDRALGAGQSIVESGERARALQAQAFANPQNPLQITDPRALQQLTDMIMAGPMGFAPAGITAWHGSPYLFRQFDPTKIGTGEGRQAYGTGAGYTSAERTAAEDFARKNLRGPEQVAYTASKGETPVIDVLKMVYPGKSEEFYQAAIQGSKTPGYLYKGDIPDEILPKFLNFDQPLKKQSKEVQDLAKKYNVDLNDLGGDLLAKVGKGKEGTAIMEQSGIRGIRYMGQEGKAENFIPFRPEDFKIQEINNVPIEDWIAKGLL